MFEALGIGRIKGDNYKISQESDFLVYEANQPTIWKVIDALKKDTGTHRPREKETEREIERRKERETERQKQTERYREKQRDTQRDEGDENRTIGLHRRTTTKSMILMNVIERKSRKNENH